MSQWSEVERQLNAMVNQWYETPEIRRKSIHHEGGHEEHEVWDYKYPNPSCPEPGLSDVEE